MSRITPMMTPKALGFALPFTLMSQAALADLTPAEVWSDWQAYMESFGYAIEATETPRGADLDVSDINLNFAVPQGNGSVQMTIDTIAFNQNSDGSVAIIMPNEMPMKITGRQVSPNGQDFDMDLTFVQTDHTMTVSGTPEAMVYDYSAATLAMDVVQEMGKAQVVPKDTAKMRFLGTDVSNTTAITKGQTRSYEQTSSIASASYAINVEVPSGKSQAADITGTLDGITIAGSGTIPEVNADMADMPAMIAAGLNVAGNIAYQSGSANFDIQDPESGAVKMQTSSQGGNLEVKVGADGLAYSGGQKNLNVAMTAAAMPIPVEMAMAETGFNLSMPVAKSEEPQDFALGFTLGDFTMSDLIWGIFDPTAQLPRDPATITLDLTGKVKVLVDIMLPQNVANINGPQADLVALKLNTLLVDVAGAKLEGDGDISFDGTGPSLVPNVGTPVGDINMALAGGNGLLDKLTKMGLLPQEQAMGARMMMGIFAVPGFGPDTLKSTIQFTQDGQILANGQRIR